MGYCTLQLAGYLVVLAQPISFEHPLLLSTSWPRLPPKSVTSCYRVHGNEVDAVDPNQLSHLILHKLQQQLVADLGIEYK